MTPDRTAAEVEAGWAHEVSGSVLRADRLVHVEYVWGTAISVTIADAAARTREALAVVDECCRWFHRVDRIFSAYLPDSEVTARRSGRTLSWSGEFAEVEQACERLRGETAGAFDPWSVPGGYDPSAFVKGWGAQRALDLIGEAGFHNALVNAGGDVCAHGDEVPGTDAGWPVGIVSPYRPDEVIEVVALRDSAMATSGRYQRGDHIVDPHGSALSVDSATVVGPDLGDADALATAAFLRGPGAVDWLADRGSPWSLYLVTRGVGFAYGPAFDGDPSGLRQANAE